MANSWESLISQWDERLRKAFLESIYALRDQAQIAKIAERLERGDIDGALRAVGIDPASFRPLDKTFGNAFEAGGQATTNLFPPLRDPQGYRVNIQFNVRNPGAERWLMNYSSTLVTEIVDDQRVAIRSFLTAGMERGLNPRAVALDLAGKVNPRTGRREGGIIGLASSQVEWLQGYERELQTNPAGTLKRQLRDKRFDAAVRRSINSGEPIPAETRAKMIAAYKNRALRYRAESIARTEAMAALHQAQNEAIKQALDTGLVDQAAVTYVWRTAHDSRVRDTHAVMDGQEGKVGEFFTTGSGAQLEFPGDPNGPASEVVNCRCWREPKIDFLRDID